MSGASVWWPTPVGAERWFTMEERAAARRYHRPVERAAGIRLVAHAVALVSVVALTRTIEFSTIATIVAVELGISLPRVAVDGWHEFVHEPQFGTEPVRVWAFIVTGVGRMVLETVGLAFVDRWLGSIDGSLLSVALVGVVAFAVPILSALFGPRFVLLMHRASDVQIDHPGYGLASKRAADFGVARPRLVVLDPAAFDGVNAFATGTGSHVTVAVSERLLGAPPDLFSHVVGHEFSHIRRRHLGWSALASGVAAGIVIASSVAVTIDIAGDGSRLPMLILLVGLVSLPLRLVLAWLSRVHERQADRDATNTSPISPHLLKQLHLSDRAAVEPSVVGRLFSAHPPPAERLDLAARAAADASSTG